MKKERYVPLKATAIPRKDGLSFPGNLSALLQQMEDENSVQNPKEITDSIETKG